MRRRVWLTSFLLVALVAACGDDNTDERTDEPTTTAAPSTTSLPADETAVPTTSSDSATEGATSTEVPADDRTLGRDTVFVIDGPRLWRIDPDGSRTELASWAWDVSDAETFQLYAMGLAVDRLTGEVAILDLLGGLGSWTEAGGFVLDKQADLSEGWANWDAKLGVSVSRMDADGWWGMTADYQTGEYTLSRYNQQDGDWVTRLDWANDLVRPLGVAAEGESGEVYVTAKGGDYRTIWRLREQGSLVDDALAEIEDGKTLWGIMPTY